MEMRFASKLSAHACSSGRMVGGVFGRRVRSYPYRRWRVARQRDNMADGANTDGARSRTDLARSGRGETLLRPLVLEQWRRSQEQDFSMPRLRRLQRAKLLMKRANGDAPPSRLSSQDGGRAMRALMARAGPKPHALGSHENDERPCARRHSCPLCVSCGSSGAAWIVQAGEGHGSYDSSCNLRKSELDAEIREKAGAMGHQYVGGEAAWPRSTAFMRRLPARRGRSKCSITTCVGANLDAACQSAMQDAKWPDRQVRNSLHWTVGPGDAYDSEFYGAWVPPEERTDDSAEDPKYMAFLSPFVAPALRQRDRWNYK